MFLCSVMQCQWAEGNGRLVVRVDRCAPQADSNALVPPRFLEPRENYLACWAGRGWTGIVHSRRMCRSWRLFESLPERPAPSLASDPELN